jgi:hypothetical protein
MVQQWRAIQGNRETLVATNLLKLAHRFDAGDLHAYASGDWFSAQPHGTFGLSAC